MLSVPNLFNKFGGGDNKPWGLQPPSFGRMDNIIHGNIPQQPPQPQEEVVVNTAAMETRVLSEAEAAAHPEEVRCSLCDRTRFFQECSLVATTNTALTLQIPYTFKPHFRPPEKPRSVTKGTPQEEAAQVEAEEHIVVVLL
jgi:hypothetical protein